MTKTPQEQAFLLETELFAFFMIAGILFADPVLYLEELVAILDALDCRLAVIKLFSLRYCIDEVPADMCPILELE